MALLMRGANFSNGQSIGQPQPAPEARAQRRGGVFRGPEAGSGLVTRKGKAPELEMRKRKSFEGGGGEEGNENGAERT